MSEDNLPGYRGKLRDLLNEAKVIIGDNIKVKVRNREYQGSLMPRVETADELHIVIKQKTGYNIGIKYDEIMKIKRIEAAKKPVFKQRPSVYPYFKFVELSNH